MSQITWDLTVKITSSNSATGHDLPLVNRCLTLDHGLRPSLGRHSLPSMLKCLRSLFPAGFQEGCSIPQKDITKWTPENYPKNNIELYHAGSTCLCFSGLLYIIIHYTSRKLRPKMSQGQNILSPPKLWNHVKPLGSVPSGKLT